MMIEQIAQPLHQSIGRERLDVPVEYRKLCYAARDKKIAARSKDHHWNDR
jgi:hypothetical protein